MTQLEGTVNTLFAGDIYEAARSVGGNANISKCDVDDNCRVMVKIPSNRLNDFLCILEERADL